MGKIEKCASLDTAGFQFKLLFNSLRSRFNHAMEESQVFEVMGEDGFARMVGAFYQKVRQDDLIGPMYPDGDWEGAEQRLRDFLIYRFGGPDRYVQQQGHPRLRMRHVGFKIGIAERDRWIELMSSAMKESEVPKEVALELKVFFEQVADFMRNVPEN